MTELQRLHVLQNEPLLADVSIHVPIHDYRSVLRNVLHDLRSAGSLHSDWKLCVESPRVAGMGFPGHHHLSDDVSFPSPSLRESYLLTILFRACFVQGRNHFNSNGQHASLGSKIFGFMWAAVACLTLATVFYCVGGASGRHDNGYSGRETRRRGFFTARRSSTRSRGSLSNGARKEAA
jgi:hypothetical protein